MTYPTTEEVNKADRYTLCKWHRFLRLPYIGSEDELTITNLIHERFIKVGGFTPEISKQLGWDNIY